MNVSIAESHNIELVKWLGVDGQQDCGQEFVVCKSKFMLNDGETFAELMHQVLGGVPWFPRPSDIVQMTFNTKQKVEDLSKKAAGELGVDTPA